VGRCEQDSSGPVVDSCEHTNEALSSVKGAEFFDQLSNLALCGLCSIE
jgi:hypothetical protein